MNKKNIIRVIVLVTTLVSLAFVPWGLVKLIVTPTPDSMDQLTKEAIKHDLDGIIIHVNYGDRSDQYAAGYHNRDEKIDADPKALFKIASISKLYLAAATTKLVEENSLSLDDTLADLLPEMVGRIENADKITLRLLLNHRSGIPNFTDIPDFPWDDPPKTNKATLKMVLDKPADFEPDQKYKYSNTNYVLLGDILNKTLGYSHHDYINEEILKPLGLKNTYNLLSDTEIDKVMSGYFIGYQPDIKTYDYINPSGSMVATAEDVAIFMRALNDGSLLGEKGQEIYESVYTLEHTGLLPGYQSITRYHKDIDAVVVLFINTSGGDSWSKAEIIYKKILKSLKK